MSSDVDGNHELPESQVQSFHQNGFLVIDRLTIEADLAIIRRELDSLFARFHSLPTELAIDLGDEATHSGEPQIPNVNRATALAPVLKSTLAYRRCEALASQLLGGIARYSFDHSIYKPPHNEKDTPWHQDRAYDGFLATKCITFWLALDDATVENGCMEYIPGSHLGPLLPHSRRTKKARALVASRVDAKAAVPCPVKAGGVTIHLPKTLHYTGPNTTDHPRRAWTLIFDLYGRNPFRRMFAPFLERIASSEGRSATPSHRP